MQSTPPHGDQNRGVQSNGSLGSSGLPALIGIGVFLLALFIAGFLIFRGDDDGDEFVLGSSTPTSTAEATGSLLATPTSEAGAGSTPEMTTPAGAASSPTPGAASPTPRTFPTLTPAPTTPPDDDDDTAEVPASPETPEDPDVSDPTDNPDPDPDDSDTEDPPVETPPQVEEPPAGEFGFLPPPQLPSGGSGQGLELDYQLATSLELIPVSATVYEVIWPGYTADDVAWMAANLGVDGDVESQGEGVFHVSGSEGSLFVAPTIIEYGAYSAGSGGPLPSSDVAIDAAWNWFAALGIDGVSAGSSTIVAVEESAGLSVVSITPSFPTPNLAPTPSARIKVSSGGIVEEATVVWPAALNGSDYGLRNGLDLWDDLRAGNAFISADLSESGGGFATMNVTDISVAYTVAGSPWEGQFLVPLVVFGGNANVNGIDVYVTAYVPAVYHQGNPLG